MHSSDFLYSLLKLAVHIVTIIVQISNKANMMNLGVTGNAYSQNTSPSWSDIKSQSFKNMLEIHSFHLY